MDEGALEHLRRRYEEKREAIRARLRSFASVIEEGDDRRLFEELVFCILTSNVSARMGLRAVERVRDVLMDGDEVEIRKRLLHAYRYPGHARYIVTTREYLKQYCGLRLRDLLLSFEDHHQRRDFFARNPGVKGLGYKQASHFLRNVGFKGYAILDKHVTAVLYELGVLPSPVPPTSRKRYLEAEALLSELSRQVGADMDEMDLLLWSEKTGEILK